MKLLERVGARTKEALGAKEPPPAWREIHQQVINGTHPQIPSYGHGSDSHLDYYGAFGEVEQGRIIIPEGHFEHSTNISRSVSGGEFQYRDEGLLPRSD